MIDNPKQIKRTRIYFSIILLFSIFYAPFWVSGLLAVVGMFLYKFYIEVLFLLFLSDLIYGIPENRFSGIVPVVLIVSVILFIIIEFTKKKLKFYNK